MNTTTETVTLTIEELGKRLTRSGRGDKMLITRSRVAERLICRGGYFELRTTTGGVERCDEASDVQHFISVRGENAVTGTIVTHRPSPKSDLGRILAAMAELTERGYATGIFEGCCRSCATSQAPQSEIGEAWMMQYSDAPRQFSQYGYIVSDEASYLYWVGDANEIIATFKRHGLGAAWTGLKKDAIILTSARAEAVA
jgi:hypothetical protein